MAVRKLVPETAPVVDDAPASTSVDHKRSLAHKLLIELLSYQLALPVRWIETQNELLQWPETIQRYVEVGPRTTLVTMAKKTAARRASSQIVSASKLSTLKFLCTSDNTAEIYYEYPQESGAPVEEEGSKSDAAAPALAVSGSSRTATTAKATVTTPSSSSPETAPPAASTPSQGTPAGGSTTPDIPLSAKHVVLAMIAQKFRRAFDNIPTQKTVQELSGGKSTLQNEIMGDLAVEFGQLPDGGEYIPLDALGDALQGNFPGKPGKQMSSLITKLISRKMPGGFNQAAMQNHLEREWGFSKAHGQVVICLAITVEPESRLESADSAREFLDGLVSRYASYAGITMTPRGKGNVSADHSSAVMVDESVLNGIKREQRDYQIKELELLSKHLQLDTAADDAVLNELRASQKSLEEKLDRWASEFDDKFFSGIEAIFDARKVRQYDSWWNWAREDTMRLLSRMRPGQLPLQHLQEQGLVAQLLRRWEPSCAEIVQNFLDTGECKEPFLATAAEILRLGSDALKKSPVYRFTTPSMKPRTVISATGCVEYSEVPRENSSYIALLKQGLVAASGERVPYVHLKKKAPDQAWRYDAQSTEILLEALGTGSGAGLTFSGKTVLVTGAGPNSIGAAVVRGLLNGGAKVIVTTSRSVSSAASFFQRMYRECAARGATMAVVPFNQASKRDCESLVEYIYGAHSPVDGDLDYLVPFGAIPEKVELSKLDGASELAHRAMLVNILRILGLVYKEKEQRGLRTRPTTVIVPLSFNLGGFGGDGLYPESKIGLEALFNRYFSGNWSDYLSICGAAIGWVRGTTLSQSIRLLGEAIEHANGLDVITFSQEEMAFNILALMTPSIAETCEEGPVYADLTGGAKAIANIKDVMAAARAKFLKESSIQKALLAERAYEQRVLYGSESPRNDTSSPRPRLSTKRARLSLEFPEVPSKSDLKAHLVDLQGMVDLSRTVVVVGFSELGPWGNARTRWQMEHLTDLTPEGYIEMAWIMGLVEHFQGHLDGKPFVGWVDAQTKQPVADAEFKEKYQAHILAHAGLRFVEPDLLGGYDPSKKEFLQEIVVEEALPSFSTSKANADAFRLRLGDKVAVRRMPESDEYLVQVKRGAHFFVPKAVPFNRGVAGLLPAGWDPLRYGIPEDIVQQVDPVTLYALCCVSEALLSAGIRDPYELYRYIHVSELANCLGTGAGAQSAAQRLYKKRYLDHAVQSDILSESFLNTTAAWVNMLVFSSTGPIKTPVGACATAIESLDIGCDAIRSGRSQVALVGGYDDFREEASYEFAMMNATASSVGELAQGRLPREMSRPSTTTRGGFVESAGCGVQLIMNAELAIEMGLPIHAIIAYTQMAGDKIGRSIPAPGQGILTAARETSAGHDSALLDLAHRRKRLTDEVDAVHQWVTQQLAATRGPAGWPDRAIDEIEATALRKIKHAQHAWGNDIRCQDPSISPLKASLATWGLTIDDVQVVSMHGTSTKANDTNEADVISQQMDHLGRRPGNPLLAVCQKALTGHPKGAAGAWQLHGCMQMLQTGIVPGNRNADNIDSKLRQHRHIVYPMESMPMPQLKAAMLTSFGFGQKGGIAVVVAARHLFSAMAEDELEAYRRRVAKRQREADSAYVSGIMSKSLFKAKEVSVWGKSDASMSRMLLDPKARVGGHPENNNNNNNNNSSSKRNTSIERLTRLLLPSQKPETEASPEGQQSTSLTASIQALLASQSTTRPTSTSIGVDVEAISSIPMGNAVFLERNFTRSERDHCFSSPTPQASFAGRWSAKEAVFKSLQTPSVGAGAAMAEIEIVSDGGVPKVQLHGRAKEVALAKGIRNIQASITHSGETVTAVALAESSPMC
ncbi:hypothetical protein MPDQ_006016 [Monascus purpureus]|uniref:FAS subunit alpha n=2 Tax=Monascus TaxID=5097 RepID=A0A507QZS0_MONPU|nr:FAS subunit alpha [Monascus ruber]QGA67212.1 FAS subunit alpha [Monascus purpureus]TQB73271.1 hypothetical protein MPDQ_006016 [Monascus purpureus]